MQKYQSQGGGVGGVLSIKPEKQALFHEVCSKRVKNMNMV